MRNSLALGISLLFLISCSEKKDTPSTPAAPANKDTSLPKTVTTTPAAAPATAVNETVKTATLKFENFEFGDLSHFLFIDEAGNQWDFTDNEDKKIEFSRELPAKETNSTNQGYGADKNLQGKWFEITYEKRDGKKLTNNLMDSVLVILSATPKK